MKSPVPSASLPAETLEDAGRPLSSDIVVTSVASDGKSARVTLKGLKFLVTFMPGAVELWIRNELTDQLSWRATLSLPSSDSGISGHMTRKIAGGLVLQAISAATRSDIVSLREDTLDFLDILALEGGFNKVSLMSADMTADDSTVPFPKGIKFPGGFFQMRFRADGMPATPDDIIDGPSLMGFRHLNAEPSRRSGHELIDLQRRKASVLARFSLSITDIENWRQEIEADSN